VDVVIGLVVLSLALVGLALVFFFVRLRAGDFDHGERLSLLPLREDTSAGGETDSDSNNDDSIHSKEGGSSYGSR
jgi:cbb3-type cytochrome oxidase maturation protein